MTQAAILAASASPGTTQGFKNRIINGAMVIDQRNAGASSVPATSSYTYTSLDRYFTSVNSPATSTAIQSTTVPTGFSYSLKIGRSGTGTAGLNTFGQVIETNNCRDLAGSSVTLSFWAKVGASATFSTLQATVFSGTVADQTAASLRSGWTGQATVATNTSLALTTTWQQFSITGSVGSTALQLAVQFIFTTVSTAGADDNLYITGIQLEAGTTATNFEYRQYTNELQLCQRYFYTIASGASQEYCVANFYSATELDALINFPVTMRTAPSIVQTSGTNYHNVDKPGNYFFNSWTGITRANGNTALLYLPGLSGFTPGYGSFVYSNNASTFLGVSAEL